jgi:hypothetical protein
MKEMSDQCITSDAATLKDLDDQIKEQVCTVQYSTISTLTNTMQKEMISRLEKEVTEADIRGETVEVRRRCGAHHDVMIILCGDILMS